jgi:hypothetical protein
MKRHQIPMLVKAAVALVALLAFPTQGLSEWRVDKPGIATLGEVGGRATLFIQCSRQGADPGLYLHQPAGETHVVLTYRFDDNAPEMRKVPVSGAGHVLKIWNDDEKDQFARSRQLRIQLRPFLVLDFDLRGIETVAAKLQCR